MKSVGTLNSSWVCQKDSMDSSYESWAKWTSEYFYSNSKYKMAPQGLGGKKHLLLLQGFFCFPTSHTKIQKRKRRRKFKKVFPWIKLLTWIKFNRWNISWAYILFKIFILIPHFNGIETGLFSKSYIKFVFGYFSQTGQR